MPLSFLDVENWSICDLFYVCTSEAPKQWEGTISKKRRSFHWFSCNSELEVTWISLIGWPHKTSSTYLLSYLCALAAQIYKIGTLHFRYKAGRTVVAQAFLDSALYQLKSVLEWKLLLNDCSTTISGNFFAICIFIFHKTKVQMIILRY